MRDNLKNKRMTKGQWAVNRERCRLSPIRQDPRNGKDEAVGSELSSLMKKYGLGEQDWIETLSGEWVNIVGKAVGRHTRPGRVAGTQVYVFVDSSVWLNELKRYGVKEMLANLQGHFGATRIRSVSLQLDPDDRR